VGSMEQEQPGRSCRPSGNSPVREEDLRAEDETLEPLLLGKGRILQKRTGYRFSIDALLLAALVARRAKAGKACRYLDLGTGCGIVPILLAKWNARLQGVGVEIQQPLASLAGRNFQLHGVDGRLQVLCADLKTLPSRFPKGCFDLVTSNPPYGELRRGQINPDPQKAVARHELAVSLREFCAVMAYLLRDKGRGYLIYPAGRFSELAVGLREVGLEPRYVRPVHAKPGQSALWVLLEAVFRGRERLVLDEPLYVQDRQGQYTEEVSSIFCWEF